MKKIIPFKKDIIFKSKISEITSISLEHTLQVENDNVISGKFIVSGDYLLTDTSTNTEPFLYELPFYVSMDERYILDNIFIDIDDFYYEIINENVLSVNIEVLIDKLEEKLIEKEELPVKERKIEELNIEETEEERTIETEELKSEEEQRDDNVMEKVEERCIEDDDTVPTSINSLFDNIDSSSETYKSYAVYIIREGDTIETVMEKYQVTKEELLDYNDLTEVKIGDKIVIPSNDGN